MRKLRIAIPLTILAIAMYAFTALAGDDSARIRAIHATPGAPNVDICANGAVAFPNVAFGDVTDYVALPTGSYLVQVVVASAGCNSTPIISQTLPVPATGDFSIAAAATSLAPLVVQPLVALDNNTLPAAGTAKVRFWHLSPNAPAVDVWAGPTCSAPSLPLFVNTAYTQLADEGEGGYQTVPAGTYTLSVCATGMDTVVLSVPDVSVMGETVYSALALGLLAPANTLEAKLVVDAGATELAVSMTQQDANAPATMLLITLTLLVAVSATTVARRRQNHSNQ